MRQFAVIGLGQFGASVARTLSRLGAEVIGIDSDPVRVEAVKNDISHAVVLDATKEESMREVGVQDVDTAVVSIGENQHANILATAILWHRHYFGIQPRTMYQNWRYERKLKAAMEAKRGRTSRE